MPTPSADTLLCRFHYDPLDRLRGSRQTSATQSLRFYCKERLATLIQGGVQRSVMQHDRYLLAQQRRHDTLTDTSLLATDQQRSVLSSLDATHIRPVAYSPYGFRQRISDLPGFNGEMPDPLTHTYPLGNGYRTFNPLLMCFHSPDSSSPFGDGGLNAYGYCLGDPINRSDPTGHVAALLRPLKNLSLSNIALGGLTMGGGVMILASMFVGSDDDTVLSDFLGYAGLAIAVTGSLGGAVKFFKSRPRPSSSYTTSSRPMATGNAGSAGRRRISGANTVLDLPPSYDKVISDPHAYPPLGDAPPSYWDSRKGNLPTFHRQTVLPAGGDASGTSRHHALVPLSELNSNARRSST